MSAPAAEGLATLFVPPGLGEMSLEQRVELLEVLEGQRLDYMLRVEELELEVATLIGGRPRRRRRLRAIAS